MAKTLDTAHETLEQRRRRAARIADVLDRTFPDAQTALHFRNPFELLIATILSAQATDAVINEITPALFKKYPNAKALAAADPEDVQELVRRSGFYKNKTRSIIGCAKGLVEQFGGKVPEPIEDLVTLPGVGRKTANVLRGSAMGKPALIIETHVIRILERLALVEARDPEKMEFELMELLPEERWTQFSQAMIWHGRKICIARAPKCPECPLLPDCPTGQERVAAGATTAAKPKPKPKKK